ncbi:hypothetical protein MLD38_018227 [Melastoma candidum]|uniref:Uncharacterized protein n=1 Tax=Melastoma candidum TaxID=119954 RepID=A0ACB9QT35_9MYRT|nr:hypothetical protein MLD38_018227 [Melastoma candidum]
MNTQLVPSSVKCSSSLPVSPLSRAAPATAEWPPLPAALCSSTRRCPTDRSNAVLAQSTKVDALAWTSSGDGLIAGGVDVVLWKNEKSCWEIAWKYKVRLPQTLVSASWSLEGLSATATHPVELQYEEASTHNDRRRVVVCKFVKEHGYMTIELRHPHPVFMIQWRPSTRRQLRKHSKFRDVLLTCCVDGAVRLWTEIDPGRFKKMEKGSVDSNPRPLKFCVVGVIETGYYPSATLDQRLFVRWATEVGQSFLFMEEDCQPFPVEFSESEKHWECEWIVGFGSDSEVKFWALHCLDEFSPLRYPRLVKWKSKELQDARDLVKSTLDQPFMGSQVLISRKNMSEPPSSCSFIKFSTCNSIGWSLLYDQESNSRRDQCASLSPMTSFLSSDDAKSLSVDGHCGKILQLVLHPYACDTGLAMSLDSNGLLLFWTFSIASNYIPCHPTLNSAWNLHSKLVIPHGSSKHTSLAWVPFEMNDDQMFLLGHPCGIDCFIVNISSRGDRNFRWHKLCTIPFFERGFSEEGPAEIFSVPLSSSSRKSFKFSRFILLAAWMKAFRVQGWEITVQCHDLSGSYSERSADIDFTSQSNVLKFEHTFGGKIYQLIVSPSLSKFPEPHCHDPITSCCVVRPSMSFSFLENEKSSVKDSQDKQRAYIMATGCSNGTLKLWNSCKASDGLYLWELVGMAGHRSPISKLSTTDSGHHIAVLHRASNLGSGDSLRVWSAVNIIAGGCLFLEDTIDLDGDVVAMNWSALGNGHQILGVCLLDKLLVYTCKRYGGHYLLRSGQPDPAHAWVCIAYTHISSPVSCFFWGPSLTAVIVHGEFICMFSQWLSPVKSGKFDEDKSLGCQKGNLQDSSITNDGVLYASATAEVLNMSNGHSASGLFPENVCVKPRSILDMTESLCGSLPVYHPEALLFSIYSGRWKRAHTALQHLLAHISSCRKADMSQKCFDIIPQVGLSSYLEGDEIASSKTFGWSSYAHSNLDMVSLEKEKREADTPSHSYASQPFQAGLNSIISSLQSSHWGITFSEKEKIEILAIIDLLGEISDSHSASVYKSLDDPGRRFWIAVRYRQLHFQRKFAKVASLEELSVDSASVCWAFQSECQENILDAFLPKESTWQELRAMGFGLWFNDLTKIRPKMEKMARLQYLKRKDPKDCALLYIALNRVQVLAGLFKLSKDEKDKPLVGFLSRNFQEEKNRAAALKNAYVLLGRHQLELAVGFFLLGGDTSSAVTVCAKNLGDEQLALVICRLVEGGDGPLENNLITKFMLPNAIEKGNYWLASLLEWKLGNYAKSFLNMLSSRNNTIEADHALSDNRTPFLDPSIGLYCLLMAAQNNMKNAVGEHIAAIFGRLATLNTVMALKKMGLPLEALEYLSAKVWREFDNQMDLDIRNSDIITSILVASGCSSSDWLSGDTAVKLESQFKYDLACQHFVKVMREHPSWLNSNAMSGKFSLYYNYVTPNDEKPITLFLGKLHADLRLMEQKFSLSAAFLFRMIATFLYNRGSLFILYGVLHCLKWQEDSHNQTDIIDQLALCLEKQTYKVAMEVSFLFSRFVAACSVICSRLMSHCPENPELDVLPSSTQLLYGRDQVLCALHSLENLRAALRIYYESGYEDLINKCLILMDLLEYLVHFAFVWRQKNSKALLLILQPLLVSLSNGHTPYNVDMTDLKAVISLIDEIMLSSSTDKNVGLSLHMSGREEEHGQNKGVHMIPNDERTAILALSLWQHLSHFVDHKLRIILEMPNGSQIPSSEPGRLPLFPCRSSQSEADSAVISNQMGMLVLCLSHSVKASLLHVSSYHVRQLAALIREKTGNGFQAMTLAWLEESKQAECRAIHEQSSVDSTLELLKDNHEALIYEILWNCWAEPSIISEGLKLEKINWSKCASLKQSTGWRDVHEGSTTGEDLSGTDYQVGNRIGSPITSSHSGTFFSTGNSLLNTWHKEAPVVKEIIHFHIPKDTLKRNGELLEALCINSTDKRKIAVSSNRKGIIFCNMGDGFPCDQRNSKMWEAEWPPHTWADSDMTSVSSSISPSKGNGNIRGVHLQVGGSTSMVSLRSADGSDRTGGGAVGSPIAAETGTSISGWHVQEDEEFVEESATVDNVRSRALSSHPSLPYFLVGSSNTHIYLWEFNKQKAVVTYGVLPSTNVPPPYAIASISAVQFDPCGQRFSTAALDGTICMWQLEVGGRSYNYPTESSICFNGHASDVTYVSSSGSVVAACGYSSNDMNVVMWDMLAPPSTSHASVSCHEGGARSIAVFDNYSGGGSVSPVILTGGKGGDVGLHDFRYIATGKTRRSRSDNGEPNNHEISTGNESTVIGTKSGVENVGGMLWYLPKAHLGSVTKISPIPGTSLFLTGGKDGDVKLWDAKTARLLSHWTKLHERHTFLQPSTRGFGGVVRAGVTDIKVISHGFITCGGDGSVKLVQLRDYS